MTVPLSGKDLLEKVKSLGEVSKSELARECGYFSVDEEGNEKIDLLDLFNAILEAKGVSFDSSPDHEESDMETSIPDEWRDLSEYEIAERIPQFTLQDVQLEELSCSESSEIRAAVAKRQDLSESIVRKLAVDEDTMVSSAIRERGLEDDVKNLLWVDLKENFFQGIKKLNLMLDVGEISDQCIDILSQSHISEVRVALARSSRTPQQIVNRLAEDSIGREREYMEVRASVRERSLPSEWKKLVWHDYNSVIVDPRISNEELDEKTLEILSCSCNPNIRSAVARSKFLPPSILKRLLEDDDLDVKVAAIKGPKRNSDSNGVCFTGTISEFIAMCDELYYEPPCAVIDTEKNSITFRVQAGRSSSLGEAILRFSGSSDDVPQEVLDEIRESIDEDSENEDIEQIVRDGVQEWIEEQVSDGACIDNDYFSYDVLFFELGIDHDESQYYSVSTDDSDKIQGWEISWKRNIDLTISLQLPTPFAIDQEIDFSTLDLLLLDVGDADPADDCVYYSLSPLAIKNIVTKLNSK